MAAKLVLPNARFVRTDSVKRRERAQFFAKATFLVMTVAIIVPLVAIVGHLIYRAYPSLGLEFLLDVPRRGMREGGIWPALVGTIYLVFWLWRSGMDLYLAVLFLFGDVYTEFWQDAGNPDFPYARIPGAAQEFGLVAPFSLAKFDNSIMGLFQDKMGGRNVSRMSGFNLNKVSDSDIDYLLSSYTSVADAKGYSVIVSGHPLYVLNIPSSNICLVYDGLSQIWTQWQDYEGNTFWGDKFARFVNRLVVSDIRNGNIYELNTNTYSDNTELIPIELTSRHLWNEDHYIGISRLQVDVQGGVGLVSGQGENPVIDLQVSKDGGNTFYSVGYSSMGKLGEYTQRVIWNTLGAARDWVFKLRATDPVKTVITGANAEVTEVPM